MGPPWSSVDFLHSTRTLGNFPRLIRFTFFQASSWPWHHSALTHLVIGDPEVISAPNYLAYLLSFSSRYLVISLDNILFFVSTNCSRTSLLVDIHPPYPFFLALLTRVHLVIDPFTLHRVVFIFTVQVYIYILHSALSTLLQPPRTFTCPSRPPRRPLDTLPFIQPTSLPLRLPRAVGPWEHIPLPLHRLSLRTWTNLVHHTHSN